MTAMFIGLVAAYVGSYVGTFTSTGNFMPLIVLVVSAGAMAVFTRFIEKKEQIWLENFSIAGSMLCGMAAAVLAGCFGLVNGFSGALAFLSGAVAAVLAAVWLIGWLF
jgi:hypothetical protein